MPLQLTWTVPSSRSPIHGYVLYRRIGPGTIDPTQDVLAFLPASPQVYLDTALVRGTLEDPGYTYAIAATSANGLGTLSNAVLVTYVLEETIWREGWELLTVGQETTLWTEIWEFASLGSSQPQWTEAWETTNLPVGVLPTTLEWSEGWERYTPQPTTIAWTDAWEHTFPTQNTQAWTESWES